MSDREQIVSYTRALRWCDLFSPGQKISRRLHWDCILFFVECNQSEKPVQRKPRKKPQKKNKHDVADGHENEAQNPWKALQGRPILQSKNSRFLAPAKQN